MHSGSNIAEAKESDANLRVVKEFAAAVSVQAQITNRVWLGLVTVALVAVVPQESIPSDGLRLPFFGAGVNGTTFLVIVGFTLITLTIAFSAAYAQQFRAQLSAQSFLDSISKSDRLYGGMNARQWFDVLRLPSFNRVAPLAQLLKWQVSFHKKKENYPLWLRCVTVAYYMIFKLTAMCVYFGLPAFALFRLFEKTPDLGVWERPLRISSAIAIVTLIQVLVIELQSLIKVLPSMWKGDS